MTLLQTLKIKIFADGADKAQILDIYHNPLISGFTTNPTLMRKAGVLDYEAFALDLLTVITDRPISFEVFSDNPDEMYRQALRIASWADNVYVKIPITNTKGFPSYQLMRALAKANVKQNITAVMTTEQVEQAIEALAQGPDAYISVFAGRIADTGRDPMKIMAQYVDTLKPYQHLHLLWASTRELLNIFQANEIGCDVITVTNDILHRLNLVGKDLQDYSLETVRMFRDDALKAGYSLEGTDELVIA